MLKNNYFWADKGSELSKDSKCTTFEKLLKAWKQQMSLGVHVSTYNHIARLISQTMFISL
jgi:hypothetical protein